MFTRRPRTIILTHQDDLTQMLGRHPDLMHESGTGRVLVRAEALDEERDRKIKHKMVKEGKHELYVNLPDEVPGLTGLTKPTDAVGNSRRQKDRLTMFMRQGLFGYFDPDLSKMPTGRIMDSVLLVQASKHARLEDMSFYEPSVWVRDHQFLIDGKPTIRKKGERVGPLWGAWRIARRKAPHLFYRGERGRLESEWKHGPIRVWFQSKATEDTIIASFLSDLIVEETKNIFMEAFLNNRHYVIINDLLIN